MATSTPYADKPVARTVAAPADAMNVPWTMWCGALAVTSSAIGMPWDVAWHRSIGRDGFWTPPHMAIYACGVIAGIICGYLILTTTFSDAKNRKDISVNVLGFRAPLGAFIALWGCVALLTSAPFDNWWHAAYGVDLKVVTPPHSLLMLGVFSIYMGMLYLILPAMNRARPAPGERAGSHYRMLRRLFLYVGGLIATQELFFLVSYTWEGKLHSVSAYTDVALLIPLMLAMLSMASRSRWAATTAMAIYTVFRLGELWILPLVPAQPKLGPVFYPVTHLVPAKFPLLLIFPAMALDLLWQRTVSWALWKRATVSGVVFVAVFVAVEWPFASFLLTKAAANWFFGTTYFNYNSLPTSADRLRIFEDPSHGLVLVWGMLRAVIYSAVAMWLGFRSGRQMRRLQR